MTFDQLRMAQSRRAFLSSASTGVGAVALGTFLNQGRAVAAPDPKLASRGVVNPLHFAPKAKRVIFLCQAGGMSHLETFDNKPKLAAMNGKPMPESFTKGQPIAQLQNQKLKCLAPQHPFKKYGKSGHEISDIFSGIGGVADEIAIVRSLFTKQINHDPAHTFLNTGSQVSGRPSMGSWFTYGLGAETEDLPGFVVMTSVGGGQNQPIASRQWHSGFLPSRYQGVEFRSTGDPVLYVTRPKGVTQARQQQLVETVNQLNTIQNEAVDDPEIATRIAQYELAFRMQTSVPQLMDLSKETKATFDMYGTQGGDGSYAANCLLARRLAEKGVRFIQLYHRGWDHHGGIKNASKSTGKMVDQGTAALIQDLKQRGMLDETLIVFMGEFGRTPMAQGAGRDHHIKGFSIFLSGGGIKGGISHGETDELGYNAVQDIVSINDLHATMMRLMGIDHLKLTTWSQGRDYRLTDLAGEVVEPLLA